MLAAREREREREREGERERERELWLLCAFVPSGFFFSFLFHSAQFGERVLRLEYNINSGNTSVEMQCTTNGGRNMKHGCKLMILTYPFCSAENGTFRYVSVVKMQNLV